MHLLLAFLLARPLLDELTKTKPPLQAESACVALNRAASLRVGDAIGRAIARKRPDGSPGPFHMETVADANILYVYSSTRRVSPNTFVYNEAAIGWIYKDEAGGYWFQRTNVDWNLNVYGKPLASRFKQMLGVQPPADAIPVSLTSLPKTIDPYFFSSPCFRGGRAFFGVENALPR